MKKLMWVFLVLPFPGTSFASDAVHLVNVRSSSAACDGKMSMSEDSDGAALIVFSNVKVNRGDPKPFVRCRLVGDLAIPEGRTIIVSAKMHGHFDKIGDQAAGKVLVTTNDHRASDFQAFRQMVAPTGEQGEEQELAFQIQFPKTISMSIQLEAMINYRLDQPSTVSAQIDSLKFSLNP